MPLCSQVVATLTSGVTVRTVKLLPFKPAPSTTTHVLLSVESAGLLEPAVATASAAASVTRVIFMLDSYNSSVVLNEDTSAPFTVTVRVRELKRAAAI